jgi:glycosyltransferase involved in cell wall biosynthesis
MRRVAFVYHRIAPETLGGAERYYQTLSAALAQEPDYEVTYLTRRYWDGPARIERDGRTVVSVDAARGGADKGRGRIWPKLSFAVGLVWHLLRHGGAYDVVHACCFPHTGVVACRLGLLPHRRTRLVADWHEVLPRATWRSRLGRLGELGFLAQRLALACGDAAIAFSELHLQRLRPEGCRAPVQRLMPEFHPGNRPPPWPSSTPREPLVVYAGRMAAEKRPHLVPATVAALRRRDPAWRGLVFGSGAELETVRAAAAEHGVAEHVHLAGFAPWEDVADGMLRGAALVFPTTREGFGLVVIEAAAHGLPVVLVAEPDNAAVELLDEGRNGSLAASADPEDLADAVLRLHADPGIHDSSRAWFEEAEQRLSVPAAVAAHRALHGELGLA